MTDWAPGDLALCIEAEGPTPPGLYVGGVYTVQGVVRAAGQTGIVIEGYPSWHPTGAWLASCFRKIHPDEQKACEPEFVTLLKRSKNRVSA